MTNLEILTKASRLVAGLIKEKTPPIFETCHHAYKTLGELTAYAADHDDEVAPNFAAGVDAVIKSLEALRASVMGKASGEKQMEPTELATYIKTQVEKSLTEETVPALVRLHALQAALTKATNSFSGGNGTVAIDEYQDPFQQATLEVDSDGKRVTSGVAQKDEVTVPAITTADVFKSMSTSVEKALREAKEMDTGWDLDLASPGFLRGERKVDFGRDGTK